jgi:hypothetical protein
MAAKKGFTDSIEWFIEWTIYEHGEIHQVDAWRKQHTGAYILTNGWLTANFKLANDYGLFEGEAAMRYREVMYTQRVALITSEDDFDHFMNMTPCQIYRRITEASKSADRRRYEAQEPFSTDMREDELEKFRRKALFAFGFLLEDAARLWKLRRINSNVIYNPFKVKWDTGSRKIDAALCFLTNRRNVFVSFQTFAIISLRLSFGNLSDINWLLSESGVDSGMGLERLGFGVIGWGILGARGIGISTCAYEYEQITAGMKRFTLCVFSQAVDSPEGRVACANMRYWCAKLVTKCKASRELQTRTMLERYRRENEEELEEVV